jgi:hypothetical protein
MLKKVQGSLEINNLEEQIKVKSIWETAKSISR